MANDTNKKAVKTVSLMIMAMLLSKVLGMFRDIFMKPLYGFGDENAAFVTASKIPLSFFEILLGAVIAGVFIPFYNSYKKDSEEQREFSNTFLSFILILTSILSFLGVIFSKQIILFIAPSYVNDVYKLTLASEFLKILFPMMIFTGATYTLVGVLQSKDEFLIPALISSVSNAGIIIYFIFLNRYFGIYGLCAAYTVSWVIQLATLIYPLYKKGFKYKFKINFRNKEFFGALKMYLPVMAGSWFIPIGDLLGNSFATGRPDSSAAVSAFDLSKNLFLIITGIFTYGICNYIFPKLSRLSASEDGGEEYGKVVKSATSATVFIIVPIALIAYFLQGEIITILYVRTGGKFTANDAEYTMQFFGLLIPAMLFFSLNEVMTRIFYSKKKMIAPMAAAFCGIGLNFALNYLFFNVLSLPSRYIALANALGQLAILLILIIFFVKYFHEILNFHFIINIVKILISSAFTFAAVLVLRNTAVKNINIGGTVNTLIYCAAAAVITLVIYASLNFLLKTDEIKEALAMINKRSGNNEKNASV